MSDNCYGCDHCESTGGDFICNYKHVTMGKEPYYKHEIPHDHLYNYGIRVCEFRPKTTFNPLEW